MSMRVAKLAKEGAGLRYRSFTHTYTEDIAKMSERITAIVRLRQSEKEAYKSADEELKLSLSSDGKSVTLEPAAPPTSAAPQQSFDSVFGGASEEDRAVYRSGVKKVVESTLLGYNGTLVSLEVGRRSEGESEASCLQDAVVRGAEQIFACLRKSRSSRSAANLVVNCSFVAVAEERVYDLLDDYQASETNGINISEASEFAELSFSEDPLQSSVHEAVSTSQVVGLLRHGQGREQRLVEWLGGASATRYHHTVLTLTVEYSQFGSMNAPISGALTFVRLSSPLPLAHPLQHASLGGNSNQKVVSLVTLAKIVKSLQPSGDGNPPEPLDVKMYSKSVLTRLLRDTLGGNCKTVFICELWEPLPLSSRAEVVAALELVSIARKVCNKPNRRDLAERALMSAYMKQLREQYNQISTSDCGEEEEEDSTHEEERHRAMEQAASALAQAVGTDKEDDEEEDEEEEESQPQTRKILVLGPQAKQHRRKTTAGGGANGGASSVTIDALVSVLQDPDRGVPRALETRLKDVKIRRDVGALFSGAGIVRWMLDNVEGVESERDAVTLGQLLLDRGAIFHSEGSMVFANADSLFYYAREARLGKRRLSPEEIQALLSHARDSGENTTSISVEQQRQSTAECEEEEEEEEEEGGEEEERGEDGGIGGEGEVGFDQSLGFSSTSVEGEGEKKSRLGGDNLQMSGGFEYGRSKEELSTEHTVVEGMEPPEDHSGPCGGEGDVPTDSRTSVESWIAETRGEEGEEERPEEGDPSTSLQQSIPSIHTLENSQDYPHPLHMAVAVGKSPGVIKNLVMMFGVDQTDEHRRTPLMFAALGNKRASVSTLIECGAVCDKQDVSGLTALHVACYHGAKEAGRVLLAKKASVVTTDKMGHTALHWSIVPESSACLQLLLHYMWPEGLQQADVSGLTALHWAIFYSRPQHLKLLLKKCSGAVEVDSSGRTLLTYAIEREPPAPQCIAVLLDTCPQLLTQRDGGSRLPLHLASIASSPVPLSLLLTHRHPKSGGPPEVNCLDSLLRTPLHYSAAGNHLQNAQVLLRAGVDRTAVDRDGRTALDYASLLEDGEAMVTLLQLQTTQLTASLAELRPQTVSGGISGRLHSHSTHSLPPLSSSSPAAVTQQTDDPSSRVCTLL